MGPLYDAFTGGALSRADFALVRNELTDRITPDGALLADRTAALMARVAPQIAPMALLSPRSIGFRRESYRSQYRTIWLIPSCCGALKVSMS